MINSKVVPFAQGADFLHARGLKQKRNGNYLDALDTDREKEAGKFLVAELEEDVQDGPAS